MSQIDFILVVGPTSTYLYLKDIVVIRFLLVGIHKFFLYLISSNQLGYLLLSNHRRPGTFAASEELQTRCRLLRNLFRVTMREKFCWKLTP